jgi:phosphopantothenate-cysteine ligase
MKVVVTGGGTIAPIDDVRSITNVSTGRFSSAISEACLRLGGEVRHIHAPHALLPFRRLTPFDLDADPAQECERLKQLAADYHQYRMHLDLIPLKVGTVMDYAQTLRETIERAPPDVIFLAMAVSDFEPEPVAGKIDSGTDAIVIHARRTRKVIREVRDWSPQAFLVGFKLLSHVSTEGLIAVSAAACRSNRADLTIANDLRTVQEGRHVVHLVCPDGHFETIGPDSELALRVVERVFALREESRGRQQG